jgi:hypothetical protein
MSGLFLKFWSAWCPEQGLQQHWRQGFTSTGIDMHAECLFSSANQMVNDPEPYQTTRPGPSKIGGQFGRFALSLALCQPPMCTGILLLWGCHPLSLVIAAGGGLVPMLGSNVSGIS